jgi:hypothetical protein
MPDAQKVQFQSGGVPMPVLSLALTVLLAVGTGYVTVRTATAAQQAEIQELQRLANTNKQEIEYLRSITATKEQTQLLINMVEAQRQDMNDIRRDLSVIRRER